MFNLWRNKYESMLYDFYKELDIDKKIKLREKMLNYRLKHNTFERKKFKGAPLSTYINYLEKKEHAYLFLKGEEQDD